ncbi:AMP-binding enzyme [Mollisia scopiformis]|uniref:AMP-binding enzyme n=1 Tax=Mollisia scopiformis TaxID=149040 RepID=A0A194XA44_MOLSC|nr:AMP-binding enzyme [Mollisia scopiformis]KUJ17009.1 AMP-binding enzyme [Mollisia scopiformis]
MAPHEKNLKKAIVQPGMFHEPPFSLEVPGVAKKDGETIPRRNAKYIDGLVSRPRPEIATLYNVLQHARDTFGSAAALGSRTLLSTHKELKVESEREVNGRKELNNKQWIYYEMSEYKWTTYQDYFNLAIRIGQSLRNAGLEPGSRVHVFAATSMRWLAMSHGATTQSMPIVTSYATLGESGLETSLVQTHAKAIFVDSDLLSKLGQPLVRATDVKLVIYNDDHDPKEGDIDRLQSLHPSLTILSFSDFLELGKVGGLPPVPPLPEDLCCIMYTSGTTGTPKGVPLKHRNVVAAIAGLNSIFKDYVGTEDSVLSYLPLAHSFEYAFENACLFWGMKMGYGSPRTMLDKSMRNCKGDIRELRPTIMVGVPAVWDQVKKGIQETVDRKGRLSRWVFSHAIKWKTWLCDKRLPGAKILDKFVFKPVREQFGGRLRACFNGAGPLSKEDRRFLSYTVASMISGYGLTETTAMGALQDPLEWTDNTLGDIPACIEIKLVDFREAEYFAKNNVGEIWIRGDAVMDGYYENESETRKAMRPDGWFKTGDIGAWDANGHLKLLDRKKNLVKTSLGEYIALEKLESIYRTSSVVSNVCIYVSGEQRTILAIVVPRKDVILQFARSCHRTSILAGMSYSELLKDKQIRQFVRDQLREVGFKGKLEGSEIIKWPILTEHEWTTENGLLTPAQKLQRRKIYPMFEEEIREVYQSADTY